MALLSLSVCFKPMIYL